MLSQGQNIRLQPAVESDLLQLTKDDEWRVLVTEVNVSRRVERVRARSARRHLNRGFLQNNVCNKRKCQVGMEYCIVKDCFTQAKTQSTSFNLDYYITTQCQKLRWVLLSTGIIRHKAFWPNAWGCIRRRKLHPNGQQLGQTPAVVGETPWCCLQNKQRAPRPQ